MRWPWRKRKTVILPPWPPRDPIDVLTEDEMLALVTTPERECVASHIAFCDDSIPAPYKREPMPHERYTVVVTACNLHAEYLGLFDAGFVRMELA